MTISFALTIAILTPFASRIFLTCAFCLGFSCHSGETAKRAVKRPK